MSKLGRIFCPLLGVLLITITAHAGGVAPGEESPREQVVREKVTVTPTQTSTAISTARQAAVPSATPATKPAPVRTAAPKVKEVPMTSRQPKAVPSTDKNSWLLGSREGECSPLSVVNQKVKNIGTFKTPQEFSRKMQQRGHQAFALDIGDVRDQVVRVRIPDMDLDLTFMRAGMCR